MNVVNDHKCVAFNRQVQQQVYGFPLIEKHPTPTLESRVRLFVSHITPVSRHARITLDFTSTRQYIHLYINKYSAVSMVHIHPLYTTGRLRGTAPIESFCSRHVPVRGSRFEYRIGGALHIHIAHSIYSTINTVSTRICFVKFAGGECWMNILYSTRSIYLSCSFEIDDDRKSYHGRIDTA